MPGLDDLPTTTHWPALPAADADLEWRDLRRWVEALRDRFDHLDQHVIPRCWWRHNGHVEALAALRDHERISFAATAPATAPMDWMRALRDVTAMLQSWTADLACGATHNDLSRLPRPPDDVAWKAHIVTDVKRRQDAAVENAAKDQP